MEHLACSLNVYPPSANIFRSWRNNEPTLQCHTLPLEETCSGVDDFYDHSHAQGTIILSIVVDTIPASI